MDESQIIKAVTPDAERILGTKARELFITVLQTKYPWLRTGRIVWARTRDFRSAMFWAAPGQAPVRLNGEDALARVSELLVANTGPLPRGLSPLSLAEAIRQLTYEPRGQIGSAELLRRVGPYLGEWLRTDDRASRERFAAQCTDPALEDRGGGQWALTFNAFNVKGGVERWQVEGDPTRIARAARTTAVEDRTFTWPAA